MGKKPIEMSPISVPTDLGKYEGKEFKAAVEKLRGVRAIVKSVPIEHIYRDANVQFERNPVERDRQAVNHVRHKLIRLTDGVREWHYNSELSGMHDPVLLRNLVLSKISEVYPELAAAAERQFNFRGR